MGKYRQKTIEIEAFCFDGILNYTSKEWDKFPEWFSIAYKEGDVVLYKDHIEIINSNGVNPVKKGDWIILNSFGEISPCNPSSFLECYEAL